MTRHIQTQRSPNSLHWTYTSKQLTVVLLKTTFTTILTSYIALNRQNIWHHELGQTATLVNAVDKAGYSLYVSDHNYIYIRQATIHTRLVGQCLIYNEHLHTFLFKGDDLLHTAVLDIYTYQRAHKAHNHTATTHATPRATFADAHSSQFFKKQVLAHVNELHTFYTPLILIIMWDF